MDALKQAFEAQFGTEWSNPVVEIAKVSDSHDSTDEETKGATEEEFKGFESEEDEDKPKTIKHTESTNKSELSMTAHNRKRFMTTGAPKDDTEFSVTPKKEDKEDLQNDLALQRMIDESHILQQRPKEQEFSGADISGSNDPLENVGKNRLKIMEHRLARAGGVQQKQRMPQAMAVGIKNSVGSRVKRSREEAKEAGIILAKERFTKSKNRSRDKGLKINSIGKASENGIHVSAEEIARMSNRGKLRTSRGNRGGKGRGGRSRGGRGR